MKIGQASFVFAALALVSPAHAQFLRAHDANSGIASNNAGVFFNLDATSGTDLSITGFDFYTWSRGFDVDVTLYTRRGGFAGRTADPGAWTKLGTTEVSRTGGLAQSDFIDTPDFVVRAGATTGVYFFVEKSGIGYATSALGSFRGRFIDDGTLRLEAGVSRNALFGGQRFGAPESGSFRGFAGNVYYNTIPSPASAAVFGLAALSLTTRRRRDSVQSR
jgi:hypothetical protein